MFDYSPEKEAIMNIIIDIPSIKIKSSYFIPMMILLSVSQTSYADEKDKWVKDLQSEIGDCSHVYVDDRSKVYRHGVVSNAGRLYYRSDKKSTKVIDDLIKNRICDDNHIKADLFSWHTDHYKGDAPRKSDAVCYYGAEKVADSFMQRGAGSYGKPSAKEQVIINDAKPACVAFFRNKYFGPEYARLAAAEKKALIAKRNKANKIAAEKKRKKELNQKRAAKKIEIAKNKEAQLGNIFKLTGLSKENRILWSGDITEQYKTDSLGNLDRHINAMNKEIINKLNLDDIKTNFVPSAKGEFEKTIDYDARIGAEKEKFLLQEKQNKEALLKDAPNIRQKIFNQYFGKPVIKGVTYDADGEFFNVEIGSSTSSYQIATKYNVPVVEAKELKSSLAKALPRVVFSVDKTAISPVAAMIEFQDKIASLRDVVSGNVPIVVGTEASSKWDSTLQQEEKKKLAKRERARKNEEQKRIERAKKYNHSGSFLAKGAYVCESMKSMFQMMTLRRANSYAKDPADCIVSSAGIVPIVDVSHIQGNISRMTLKNGGVQVFAPTSNIIY